MYKLIGNNNKVNYGCIDEPIEWNYEEFKLLDFFNKEVKGFKKNFAYHQFNYIGITAGEYIVGFATVDLIFKPEGERNDQINVGPLVKTVFRQFVGTFDGFFKQQDGKKIAFEAVKGFCEIHKAIW